MFLNKSMVSLQRKYIEKVFMFDQVKMNQESAKKKKKLLCVSHSSYIGGAEKSLVNAQKLDYNSKSSLLVDIENNRRTEIESLNGTLVRIAKKVGVDVPVNKLIYGAIRVA